MQHCYIIEKIRRECVHRVGLIMKIELNSCYCIRWRLLLQYWFCVSSTTNKTILMVVMVNAGFILIQPARSGVDSNVVLNA